MSSVIGMLKKQLELEQQAKEPLLLPEDFYYSISKHARILRRSLNNNNAEITNSLIQRQIEMLGSVSSMLLNLRLEKALKSSPEHLLPEERSVFESKVAYKESYERLANSIVEGKQSYLEYLRRQELKRKVVVRFLKEMGEIVGSDLNKYGPFKVGDVATIPWLNARIFIAGGEAVSIKTRKNLGYE